MSHINIHDNNYLIELIQTYQENVKLRACVETILYNRKNLDDSCFEQAYYELKLRQLLYNIQKPEVFE